MSPASPCRFAFMRSPYSRFAETNFAQTGGRVKQGSRLPPAGSKQSSISSARGAHGAVAGELAQPKYNGIADRVIDEVSGALAAHQPGLAQGLEVFRGVGLAGMQGGRDFAHGPAAALEEMQDAQPGGVAQQAEPFRGDLDLEGRGQ
jgi:hypothetical protein